MTPSRNTRRYTLGSVQSSPGRSFLTSYQEVEPYTGNRELRLSGHSTLCPVSTQEQCTVCHTFTSGMHTVHTHSTHRSAHSVPDTEVQLHNCTYVHGQLGGSGVEICTIMSKSAKGISNPFTKVQTVSTVHKKMAGQLTMVSDHWSVAFIRSFHQFLSRNPRQFSHYWSLEG